MHYSNAAAARGVHGTPAELVPCWYRGTFAELPSKVPRNRNFQIFSSAELSDGTRTLIGSAEMVLVPRSSGFGSVTSSGSAEPDFSSVRVLVGSGRTLDLVPSKVLVPRNSVSVFRQKFWFRRTPRRCRRAPRRCRRNSTWFRQKFRFRRKSGSGFRRGSGSVELWIWVPSRFWFRKTTKKFCGTKKFRLRRTFHGTSDFC